MNKILICNESLSHGGLGTYTLNLIEGMQARGWNVSLLVTDEPGDYFQSAKEVVAQAYDLSSTPLSMKKLLTLVQIIIDQSPDILLLNHCSLSHYALPMLPENIKPIAVLHNDIEWIYRVAKRFERRIYRWIAPSDRLKVKFQSMVSRGLGSRVETIHHGIDTTFHRPREENSSTKTVVFIGNLGQNKGADLLPAIFRNVVSELPDVQFSIIGEGALYADLLTQCREAHLNAELTGYIPKVDVFRRLRNANILILPTRVEGFGLVIAEAMSCGVVPVVSCLSGVTDTIVDDGKTGILVTQDDVTAFAVSVLRLLKNPPLLRSMSGAARQTAVRRFSVDRMLDNYEKVFYSKDDRGSLPQRQTAGWVSELAVEMMRKGFNTKWFVRRLQEFLK